MTARMTAAQKRDAKLLRSIRAEIRDVVEELTARPQQYAPEYSVLTVHFAEGSEPLALSIPYKPWENRADIHVPLLVVKAQP